MKNKIMLVVTGIVLLSLKGLSQSTEKSEHPLLDKYYPQPQKIDTNRAVGTQIKTTYEIKPSGTGTAIPVMKPAPVMAATPSDSTTQSVSTIPSMTTSPVVTSTTSVNKPTTIAPQLPAQTRVQIQPAPASTYMDTRLGSSTKAYDTWEKNNNGAGSVTTSPK